MTTVQVERASVRLGGQAALVEASLALGAGWTAIVGPNGAGKSTLLRAIAGLQPLDAGDVRLDGDSVSALSPRVRATRVAWLAQQAEPAGELTVAEVVALGRLPSTGLLGQASEDDAGHVEQALRDAGCDALRDRRLGALSGGERQRVHLARALAVGAPMLLLDEPTANLDPPYQAAFVRLVRAQLRAGRAVVSVLHDLTLALCADRLVVMAAGRICAEGRTGDPVLHRQLAEVFGGAVRIVRFEERWLAVPQFEG